MIVLDTDKGFYLFDMSTCTLLKEFKLSEHNPYLRQNLEQQGKLKVFSLAVDLPYNVHVVSNHGIFIYTFEERLDNRNDILQGKLVPKRVRVIRMQFEYYNYRMARNKYGYAFLVTKSTGRSTFDVYVGAVSYYSSQNSQMFRKIYIASNQQCHSLTHQPYLATNLEDMLVVSLVCDTQLIVIRICMRPHLVFNFDRYQDQATRLSSQDKQYHSGALSYNQF